MQNYVVTPEFKQRVTDILNTKKFTQVFPFMNLINREGFQFTETELNQLVQFLGEFAYNEVAELFNRLPAIVTQELPETLKNEPVKKAWHADSIPSGDDILKAAMVDPDQTDYTGETQPEDCKDPGFDGISGEPEQAN
jgi:hypothetical protein